MQEKEIKLKSYNKQNDKENRGRSCDHVKPIS
jgi:hypothetical protein